MKLQAAHQGYVFQDLATGIFLIQAIIDRYDNITIDKKKVSADKFDDLTFTLALNNHRFQFKGHKIGTTRRLTVNDFKEGTLKLSELAKTYKLSGTGKYRICVTWLSPEDDLTSLIEEITVDGSFTGIPTKKYRLKIEEIWPAGKSPIWANLSNSNFNRDDLSKFLENLIIECEIPQPSLDLSNPGALEELLINTLEEKVGIGRYPNESDPIRFADSVIRMATLSRATSRKFTVEEIIHELNLVTDFGRIDQQSPVVERRFIYRDNFQKTLTTFKDKSIIVLTGPPGAGKSWALSKAAKELNRKKSTIAAIHYCYLHPGDKDVQKRITSNVLFGNLISEILSVDHSLQDEKDSLFSADLKELELLLKGAAKKGKRVCLIVDGLDHISRVYSEHQRELNWGEVDIVEKLSAIDLPADCYLVIGSQPGKHLDPLLARPDCVSLEVPGWIEADIRDLTNKLGINTKIVEKEEEVIRKLTEKSEGKQTLLILLNKALKLMEKSQTTMNIYIKRLQIEELIPVSLNLWDL
jgi:thymidylate kinase